MIFIEINYKVKEIIANNEFYDSLASLENTILRQVIEYSHDGITVTDNRGNVIIANPPAIKNMELRPEDVVGHNVEELVKKGVYNPSTIMEAIETKSKVTKLIRLNTGKQVMSTSIPLIDNNGNIVLVITNTRTKELVDTYIMALEEERNKSEQYKSVADYLYKLDIENKPPVFNSKVMNDIYSISNTIAKTESTVLLLGESGTGKEVFARYIHKNSARAKESFIPVNCAAIPSELMESEFFGYEKGAFTGASAQGKLGIFEIANNGTLFLDEIGELPLTMQSKLLRVLETGEVKRVGGTSFKKTNARLIAATNKDLKSMIYQDKFRKDLYYRLNVIPISIPPLRDRPEDVITLSDYFLKEYNNQYGFNKRLSQKTIQSFLDYDWPGNARELRNLIERLVIITPEDELNFECEKNEKGNENYKGNNDLIKMSLESGLSLKEAAQSFEKQYINEILEECNGRIGEAANLLGIHRTMLYRKMKNVKEKIRV